jgi:predicted PurR-regulated permease PerM
MSAAPKPQRGAAAVHDHEHVGRISTPTTLTVLVVTALILYEIQWILPPFVFAALIAYICTPPIDWMAARARLPRALFASITFLILLLIAALVGWLGIPPLVRELTRVLTDFQSIVQALANAALGEGKVSVFGTTADAGQVTQAVVGAVRSWLGQAGNLALLGGVGFASMFGAILTLVLLCYFLLTGPSLARGALMLVPPKQRPLIVHICLQLDPVLRRYFVGVLVVVAYASVAAYIGLGLFLGIPHAAFLALLTGFLEMLPVVGPGASAVIAGLVAVHYAKGIGPIFAYAMYATALRISIDQVFGPLALGTAARVHPVLVILCFLAGGLLFGVIGVIMAVPVALVVKVTLAWLYDEPQNLPHRAAGH